MTLLANGVVDGEPLTDAQIESFMLLLFPAGVDTTWLSLGTMMTAILSTPGALDELRARPEMRTWAVEETLRWGPPVALQPRITVKDVEVRGVVIPAGSMTMLAIARGQPRPRAIPRARSMDPRPPAHAAPVVQRG